MRTIALDFETTGISVHKDNVFNIGAFDGTLELDLFIKSYGGEQIQLGREIYDLTGINTQILNSTECRAESRRIQFEKLLDYIRGDGSPVTIVWHNGKSFDSYFLVRALKDEGLTLPENINVFIDTYLWARYDLKLRSDESTLCKSLGVEDLRSGGKHLALQDSKMLFQMYWKMVECYQIIPHKRKESTRDCISRVMNKICPGETSSIPIVPKEISNENTLECTMVTIRLLEQRVSALEQILSRGTKRHMDD